MAWYQLVRYPLIGCIAAQSMTYWIMPAWAESADHHYQWVILGGGASGIAVASQLMKRLKDEEKNVLLIEPNTIHAPTHFLVSFVTSFPFISHYFLSHMCSLGSNPLTSVIIPWRMLFQQMSIGYETEVRPFDTYQRPNSHD